ncbi:multicopper oxidase [Echria macrotheca]|uniref:Multicopper oxidase n=1 Tax=Echria macrotheca TaxID=438768 RepID=A0AAJ0BEI5_9PEZI|nr:multicopper oxidase [Echria macrotheca]
MRGLTNSLVWLTAALAAVPSVLASPAKVRSSCGYKKFELTLTWEKGSPDGVERDLIKVNGQFPGPTLEFTEGDHVEVLVHNKMPFNTTVHYHGIEQKGTPWSDGVPGVTQRQVQPKESFLYKFEATQYGSYWYHAHQLGQLEDGMLGAIIIHPKKSRATPFSKITTDAAELKAITDAAAKPYPLILSDWRHRTAEDIIAITHAANMELPCFDSILFNGKGSVNCLAPEKLKVPVNNTASLLTAQQAQVLGLANITSFTPKGCMPPPLISKTVAPNVTVYPEKVPADVLGQCTSTNGPKEVIKVEKGSESSAYIAIDLIGAFSLITGTFSIDEHQVWVYAVDGEYIIPQKVEAISITNGDRYSILVKLTEQGTFPVRFASTQNSQILVSAASLVYGSGAPKTTKPYILENGLNATATTIFFSQKAQKQLEPITIPKDSDVTHKLNIRTAGASYEWALNNNKFPASIMDHGADGVALFKAPSSASDNATISNNLDQWVDLIIVTATKPTPPHPIHKHGTKMWQIGAGIGDFTWANVKEAAAAVPQFFNFVDPPHRDGFATAQASPFNATWTVLRYHATEAGPWLLHCHVQSHLIGGMTVILQDGVDKWPVVPKAIENY